MTSRPGPKRSGPVPIVWHGVRRVAVVVATALGALAKIVTGQGNGYNTLPATPPKAPDEYRP